MSDETIPRRRFLVGAGTAVASSLTPASPATPAVAQTPANAAEVPPQPEPLLTLTETEHAFVAAAADTLIPADELSPSGSQCGVVAFIDRQLAGAYGNGARLYRDGPFPKGKPELGYQLPLNPREFFRAGIAAANEWSRQTYGKDFDRLAAADRDAALKAMEAGKAEFSGSSSRMFFEAMLQIAMEGFFADPVYGGNRDMAGWKMIGFPGTRYDYRDWVERHNEKYPLPPVGITGRTEWTVRHT
jgi:gluconate 2-dehydrogenase gamma chain